MVAETCGGGAAERQPSGVAAILTAAVVIASISSSLHESNVGKSTRISYQYERKYSDRIDFNIKIKQSLHFRPKCLFFYTQKMNGISSTKYVTAILYSTSNNK